MAETSMIEWTDATWNPITGCTMVSAGCTNCYAMGLAATRLRNHPSRSGLTRESGGRAVWTGEVRFNEQWIDQPLRWTRPRRIFVCAHGDLFHEAVPDEWIDRVFAVMALAPQHTFQVLTKRPERARKYLTATADYDRHITIDETGRALRTPTVRFRVQSALCDLLPKASAAALNAASDWQDEHFPDGDGFLRCWPLPNIWLGTSIEDQATADARIPHLLETPAAVRFLSAEPLLGPVVFPRFIELHNGLRGDWPFGHDTCAKAGVHRVVRNQYGARSIIAENGKSLGVKPHECTDLDLDWVIVGGESGRDARPMHPDWARSLRDQCQAAGVAFFFKQWGMWLHESQDSSQEWDWEHAHGNNAVHLWDDGTSSIHLRKTQAGRELDGRTWDEVPA